MNKPVRLLEVDGEEMKRELARLSDILSGCYGPWGGQALLVSTPAAGGGGGVVTLTRRSAKLLQLLRIEYPLTKTIISHLEGHAQGYKDSTLYAGMLACK